MLINGLDSFLAKVSPKLMLRPNQAVSLDWLAETFNCNAEELYQTVLKGFRSKANAALKRHPIGEPGEFYIVANDKFSRYPDTQTAKFKTMEEMYVWTDLHAN